MTLLPPHMYSVADKIGYIHEHEKNKPKKTWSQHSINSPTMTWGSPPAQIQKIQMKAFRNNTTRHFQINTSPLILLFFPSMLNSAWWPTPLEQTWKHTGDVLNTLNSVNNAEADCKSVYAPGGWVNKGDCSALYFLFTHLCSARWRSGVVSLKPYSRVFQQDETQWPWLENTKKHSEHTHFSASLTKSIFNTPSCCLLRNTETIGHVAFIYSVCVWVGGCVRACMDVCWPTWVNVC